jgi:NAD-dependent SIR2 family protein deacetylase
MNVRPSTIAAVHYCCRPQNVPNVRLRGRAMNAWGRERPPPPVRTLSQSIAFSHESCNSWIYFVQHWRHCFAGVLKPDVTFFGEDVKARVGATFRKDFPKADLVVVLGTSMQIAPMVGLDSSDGVGHSSHVWSFRTRVVIPHTCGHSAHVWSFRTRAVISHTCGHSANVQRLAS